MKKVFWSTALVLSIVAMVIGFLTSLLGMHYHEDNVVYIGLVIIAVTCVSWWIWVMTVIKAMIDFAHATVSRVSDIREGIKEVRHLFREYEKLRKG